METWWGVSSTGDPEVCVKEDSRNSHLPLHCHPIGEPGGGVHLLVTLRDDKGGLSKRNVSLYGSFAWETWRGAPLLATLKDMYRKTLATGIFLHRGPAGDHGGDPSLPGTSKER